MVQALEGAADDNRDGIVTADEMAEYVRRNVREETANLQTPTSDRASFDPDMLLAYVPSNRQPDAPPPPEFGTLVIQTNMDGVEVFIDGRSEGIVDRERPLRLPGLRPGLHTVRGVKLGYEPDGPREEIVYPGQEATVSIRILIAARRLPEALNRFNDGLDYYNGGGERDYQRAVREFRAALGLDQRYSQAALYLGRSYNALFDQANARRYFQQAIDIDPDYLEARASFGGMLLDVGDLDEAIRHLNAVVVRNSDHGMANYLLGQAFCRTQEYGQAIEHGRRAVALIPQNAEAHFWLAQSLRMNEEYAEARSEYLEYLRLSDFDSSVAGKLNYYVLGFLFGKGRKARASQHDIWEELQSEAYFGLCNAEYRLGNQEAAVPYCQRSLSYRKDDPDPYTLYLLGLVRLRQSTAVERDDEASELMAAARQRFQAMLDINPYLAEADFARQNIANISEYLESR